MLVTIGIICSIINSLANTGSIIVTQKSKTDPAVLAIYRGLGTAFILLPFLIFIPYPTDTMFYTLCIANGLLASASFRRVSSVIEEYGGEISSKFFTIPPVLVAIIWWIIRPTQFAEFVSADPIKAIGAIFCLLGMLFTIFALGHNKNTHKATIASIPIFICYTIQAFLTFFALQKVSIAQGMFYYVFLQGLIIGAMNYFVHIHHLKGHAKDQLLVTMFDKKVLKAGLLFIISMIIARFTTNVAFKLLPNPAYVHLICNLQIIWIYLASKTLHIKNSIPPAKGVILAIYAIMFIVLTY